MYGYTLSSLHKAINLTFMQLPESLIAPGLVIVKHKVALNCWVWFYFSGVCLFPKEKKRGLITLPVRSTQAI